MQYKESEERESKGGMDVPSPAAMLPKRPASRRLGLQLRAAASREAQRAQLLHSPPAMAREFERRLHLWLNNFARPVALPFAGGLASAMFLFLSIAPAFPSKHNIVNDVPVRLATPASLDAAFSVFTLAAPPTEDIILDVEVDSEGRAVDYVVMQGQSWASIPEARKSIESTLVRARFSPATRFGQPQAGNVRITLRRNEIELQG